MSKHQITGFITYRTVPWMPTPEIDFTTFDPRKISDTSYPRLVVREHSFEVEVSDDFDPRPQQVAALQAEKQKLRAAFAKRITELDDGIAKLLAIGNEVSA